MEVKEGQVELRIRQSIADATIGSAEKKEEEGKRYDPARPGPALILGDPQQL